MADTVGVDLRVNNFTLTYHHKPGPALDTAVNRLPNPFHACIIGASRGIGAGFATTYAKAGASILILAARSIEQLKSVASTVNSISPSTTVHIHVCDIATPSSVKKLAEFAKSVLPSSRLDILVVNSGVFGAGEANMTEGDAENGEWKQAFEVNALGVYYAAHYFVPILLASPEESAKAFIAVGALAATIKHIGSLGNSRYCISKVAQTKIVEHLADQFGEKGLFAATVHPGMVDTVMAKDVPDVMKPHMIDDLELCGAFCLWLTKNIEQVKWLNGRLVSANWDPEELLGKREEIERGDLLKFELTASMKN